MKTKENTELLQVQDKTPSLDPTKLIQLAIENKADIGQLEKLMGLQERWAAGIAKKNFLSAISGFQRKVPVLKRTKKVSYANSRGGKTEYKFAALGDIDASIKNILHEFGLSKRWELNDKGELLECVCIISHIDGHSEKTIMTASKDDSGGKNAIQQRGSTISYLQRYTLISALGISTADEDTDGEKPKEKEAAPVEPKENKSAMSSEEEKQIKSELLLQNTEEEVMNYATNWPQFKKNIIFKNLCQGRVAQIPVQFRMSPEQRRNWIAPTNKK